MIKFKTNYTLEKQNNSSTIRILKDGKSEGFAVGGVAAGLEAIFVMENVDSTKWLIEEEGIVYLIERYRENYRYCLSEDCIHRRGCSRYLSNYSHSFAEKAMRLSDTRATALIEPSECVPNLKDVDCENKYDFLDRFRLSDGSELSNVSK